MKFRVWDKILKCFNEDIAITSNGSILTYDWHNVYGKSYGHISATEEENYVVQRFTGLLDKNNKEIYEGDIIECGWITRRIGIAAYHFGRYLVVSPEDYLNDILSRPSGGNCWYISELSNMITSSPAEIFEIVGNIYENPKLLTK